MNELETSSEQTSPPQKPKRRDTLLAILLAYFGLGNLYVAYRNAEIYWDLVAHSDPNLPHWPFLAFSILAALAFISVVGIWFWKKWGLYLYVAVQVLSILVTPSLIESYGLSKVIGLVLIGSIGPAIFLTVLYQKRHYFD